MTAACRADDVKSNADRERHDSDIGYSPDGTKPVKGDAVGAIETFAKQVGDKALPDEQRARALRYLLHLVGDIHQPLHCATHCTQALSQGDRGGNDFKMKGEDNLRSCWDGGVGIFVYVLRPLSASGHQESGGGDSARFPDVGARLRGEVAVPQDVAQGDCGEVDAGLSGSAQAVKVRQASFLSDDDEVNLPHPLILP